MVSFRSYPTRNRIFQKNSRKIQKIRKYRYGFISIQNMQENSEKETNSKLSFCFVPTRRVIENSEKIAKKFKIKKKQHYKFISSQSRLEKDEKERNKNYRSISFLPDACYKLPKKIAKKFKKLKSTVMATFQAKIGRKRIRKREIKITVPFRSYPT